MQATPPNPAPQSGIMPYPLLLDSQYVAELTGGSSLPPVPTLLATRLQLQLLLSERSVDLRAASGIILNDIGATLEIFRRAGEECDGEAPSARLRVEDCLAALGTEAWMDAVCSNAVERVAANDEHLSRLLEFWEHSRVLAYSCSVVAEHTEAVCPEEAYLVGLLHEAAQLPELLCWHPHAYGASPWKGARAAAPAAHWHLPPYLETVVAGVSAMPAHWRNLLQIAHAWSRGEQCILSYTA